MCLCTDFLVKGVLEGDFGLKLYGNPECMDNELILRNKLKIARAEKNFSQGDLAKMAGVSRQTISSI